MATAGTLLEAAAALALLWAGGELLVRGAAALALRLGVAPLAVGLTVVAFGTSAPELVVSLDAAISGANDVSLGNVVGSNICNVALILGLAALLRPTLVQAKLVRFDCPLLVLVSLVLVGMLANAKLSRAEGGLLLAGLVAFTAFTFRQARAESQVVREEFEAAAPGSALRNAALLAFVPAGLLGLVLGGHLLVESAIVLAEAFGVSQAVIGLTIVAVGTSLPELATSTVAAVRGQGDIAVGNVIGSNLFNILGILGVTALVRPLARGEIGWADLGVMLAASAVLIPLLHTGLRLDRREGALLLASYAAYLAWLISA